LLKASVSPQGIPKHCSDWLILICITCILDVWRSGTFPEKPQVSECATDHKHRL